MSFLKFVIGDSYDNYLEYYKYFGFSFNTDSHSAFLINFLIIYLFSIYFWLVTFAAGGICKKIKDSYNIIEKKKKEITSLPPLYINYQKWKTSSYNFYNNLINFFKIYGSLLGILIICFICQINFSIANLVIFCSSIIYIYVVEFEFNWPYFSKKSLFLKYITIFLKSFIMIVVILHFIIAIPYIRDKCSVYICYELINMTIIDKIFMFFFLTLISAIQKSNSSNEFENNIQHKEYYVLLRVK